MSDGPSHWTEDFFQGAWLEVQRRIHPVELSRQQAGDLSELLQLEPGERVLDAPCGEGRLSLALAEQGMQTVGVDRCRPLLDDARREAERRGLDCRFEELDLREVDRLGGLEGDPFDAALCIWGSFGYFGDAGVAEGGMAGGDMAFARAVAQVLRPGGHFVIDCPGLEMIMARYSSRGWFDAGPVRVLEQRAWDPLEGTMHVEWTLVHELPEGPRIETRQSAMRIYSAPELARLLSRAGFRRFDLFSDLAGTEWKPGDRMVMVAER